MVIWPQRKHRWHSRITVEIKRCNNFDFKNWESKMNNNLRLTKFNDIEHNLVRISKNCSHNFSLRKHSSSESFFKMASAKGLLERIYSAPCRNMWNHMLQLWRARTHWTLICVWCALCTLLVVFGKSGDYNFILQSLPRTFVWTQIFFSTTYAPVSQRFSVVQWSYWGKNIFIVGSDKWRWLFFFISGN